MNKKFTEKLLENKLIYFFCNDYKVTNQVPLSKKKIDIVLRNEDEIWAIEVKIKDWKTAVRQANLNTLGCHKSYVAIWHRYAKSALKSRHIFDELGIGLIVIDENYTPQFEVLAKGNANLNPIAHNYLINSFYG